jgi:DNA-binding YbaB/EbfC family protein
MADFMKILQQAQEMQGKFQKLQEELQQQTVTASAGGGMVTVEANGQGAVRSIKIDPSVVNPADVEMLEDLVLVAVTEAQKKAQDAAQREMGKLTGGLPLPFKLPF